MERIMSYIRSNVLSVLSRLIAAYFIWVFHLHVGFPPTEPLTATAATYLALFIFFLVLPFAQRLKLGELIEFEAKVEQVRAEVKEVRTETRELISIVSVAATAISASMNQSVVVNLPGGEEARVAREELSEAITHHPEPTRQEKDILEYLDAGDSDQHYALARLRMDLERELRRVLGKRLELDDPSKMQGKFVTARPLFRRLVSAVPQYQHMQSSFDYVLRVCNAAVHGQRIPESIAREAVDMGLRMLRELEHAAEL